MRLSILKLGNEVNNIQIETQQQIKNLIKSKYTQKMGSSSSSPSYPGARAANNRPNRNTASTGPNTNTDNQILRGRRGNHHHYQAPRHSLRHHLTPLVPPSLSGLSSQTRISAQRRSSTPRKPGAYSITPVPEGASSRTMERLAVPPGVRPGMDFLVNSGSRTIRVRCPPNVHPGQLLDITVPPEPFVGGPTDMASLTLLDDENIYNVDLSSTTNRPAAARAHGEDISNSQRTYKDINPDTHNETKLNSPGVTRIPNPDSNGAQAYQVKIPPGIRGGQQFVITIQNQKLAVTCPAYLRSGNFVRVVPPASTPSSQINHSSSSSSLNPNTNVDGMNAGNFSDEEEPPDEERLQRQASRPQVSMQMFEVVIPMGVTDGQPFTLTAGGQRVLVTCPPNTTSGQRIRFQLPIPNGNSSATSNTSDNYGRKKINDAAAFVKLNYDTKDGWTRTIRLSDYKFQWIRTTAEGQVKAHDRFSIETSAFVRKLEFIKGKDYRMRTGKLSLVPASDAAVSSSVMSFDSPKKELVSYADIFTTQTKSFKDKVVWFQDMCELLRTEWNAGHMRLQVRRDYLLSDSLQAVMSMGRDDLRKTWRFEFLGEQGIDAGGLAREWFQLVTEEIFNPDRGLWFNDEGNQMCMQINASSKISCGNDHLVYFRFLGRVMGKALFDQRLISGHMIRHAYKHILGWPVTFSDLELIDEQYFLNMKKLTTYDEDELAMLCLDFTYTEQSLGVSTEIELAKNGKNIDVTKDNLPEYLEACTKYRLMGRVKSQMKELLLGFYDIIPEPLLTVFDFQELELLMCGLPEIDMEDWKANTEYLGTVKSRGKKHPVVKWFWEVVEEDFDQALKAKLLQFATGTSGVPTRGFSVLQGNDGNIRKFSIQGVSLNTCLFPRSHTCFNRIDLPMFTKKKDLRENLMISVQIEPTGFSIE